MSRITLLVFALAAATLTGCAVIHESSETRNADGTVTRTERSKTVYTPSAYVPISGIAGGYQYVAPVGRLEIVPVFERGYGRVAGVPMCVYPNGARLKPQQPGNKC